MNVYADRNIRRRVYEILFIDRTGPFVTVGMPVYVNMVEHTEEHVAAEPTLTLPFETAQALFQALWDSGLRPASGEGLTAESAALKAHIRFAEHIADRLLDAHPRGLLQPGAKCVDKESQP